VWSKCSTATELSERVRHGLGLCEPAHCQACVQREAASALQSCVSAVLSACREATLPVLKLCWVSAAVAAVAQPQQQAAAASSFGKACLEIVLDPVGCSCSHCGPGWAGLHVQVMMSAAAVPVYCMAYAH
jgi:hypothetical protein